MTARRTTIRQLPLTEVVDRDTPGATPVSITTPEGGTIYHTVPLADPDTGTRRDARPQWIAGAFPLFPVVRLANGAPWAEANLWLIDMMESKSSANMLTFASIADDLVAFCRYLDDEGVDWLTFPVNKRQRPTYRYSASIRLAVQAGELSAGVARRRMGAVVRFYRWLVAEAGFRPANAPWVESGRFIEFRDQKGFGRVIEVKTTDLSISGRRVEDPWDDRIQDGGRLRPLASSEQSVLLESLAALGNTEMTLVHLFALLTGARIQTVLTVRAKHVMRKPGEFHGDDIRLACGPGTGIDTKGGVKGVLHLPRGFYERLYVYVHSDRARNRRQMADGGDHSGQPLFLSHRGAQLDEPSRKLLGQRADRELVGIAQASAHPWPALCNASRSNGRGNRLVELLQSFALALDVGLRQPDAIRAGLVRHPEPTGGIISAQLRDPKFAGNLTSAASASPDDPSLSVAVPNAAHRHTLRYRSCRAHDSRSIQEICLA